ncbi:hypothetical protein [Serratia bockelmannii]|uniref:hypothetical protein n=1 Tax=Serratia bockelmannii TaxID=2703793 RepID=UPI003F6ACD55
MTLTTERQQFEEWFTNKYPRSYWGVEKTASGEYQGGLAAPLWEAWQESRGCMANREAQPVAVVISRGNLAHVTDGDLELGTKLYTAQPAPAVPGIDELRLTFERSERESDDGFNLHKYGIGYADESTQARWESWLACRAAMLAAAPEGGNDHDTRR